MKTLLIAAAAAATLAGAALPAAAQSYGGQSFRSQSYDHGYRPVLASRIDQRFDRDGAWRSWREREIERRIVERRRLEWLTLHRHDYGRGYEFRDGGYGYGR